MKDGHAQGVLTIESEPEVIESEDEVIPPEDEDAVTGLIGAGAEEAEAFGVYRDKKLLQKTIKDLDAYRIMLKNIGSHNDDYSRFLLIEEAGKYIDKHVDPRLNSQMTHLPEIFNLIAPLRFFKACVFYESGEYNKYKEMIKGMEKEYGDKHLSVAIAVSNEEFNTIGEAIQLLQLKTPKK
ncbi:MAG: hypothetical protein IME96_11925 [Proteobacteria bacterium]|nr:hypothetical protein [Pseudomonadota bacterium]